MLNHIAMMCNGDQGAIEYVINWLAFCVQFPASQPEVALVFRGGRGTGKGTLARLMLGLFGGHGLHIANGKLLTGDFNGHLRNTLFLFVDEGFWAGDKSGEGVLKALITEPTITINGKGKDAFSTTNYLKIMFASNDEWVVPAGADERRYQVNDVPNIVQNDHKYFEKLNAWIDDGGDAAWLDFLLGRDLSAFNPRIVPNTAALNRQKLASMSAFDRWVLEMLELRQCPGLTGTVTLEWTDAPVKLICTQGVAHYKEYLSRSGSRFAKPLDARAIGDGLRRIFGIGSAQTSRDANPPAKAWTLPGITEARELALKAMGITAYQWGE
jgi:hypothetical protein